MKAQDLSDKLGGGQQQPPTPDSQQLSKAELKDLDSVECPGCGGKTFDKGLQLKKIPSVHPANPPGSNEEMVQPVGVLACINCGTIQTPN